ncbi:MAG TPA: hypothetical protein VES90_03435 [Candidatus Eisenbacteria bacterium]|nr:hypothetical protein [Candidatus Eisenbacteria bacterium]
MAAHAYSVMDSYIYGFALQQMALPASTWSSTAWRGSGHESGRL